MTGPAERGVNDDAIWHIGENLDDLISMTDTWANPVASPCAPLSAVGVSCSAIAATHLWCR